MPQPSRAVTTISKGFPREEAGSRLRTIPPDLQGHSPARNSDERAIEAFAVRSVRAGAVSDPPSVPVGSWRDLASRLYTAGHHDLPMDGDLSRRDLPVGRHPVADELIHIRLAASEDVVARRSRLPRGILIMYLRFARGVTF